MTFIRDLLDPKARRWEEMYRNRWQHDSETRSTHGVNCTGGCSWVVYVKEGIVTWEMQATDYPALEAGLPGHEPRGCQRGIAFSWHVYAPTRVKYPYLRGALADLWARARAEHADPVEAWASLVEDEASRRAWQQARGRGGLRRATWEEALELVAASLLYTAKRHGPDRVIGFSPIPAMSMVSYAAGSRFLQLFGGALLSFYDLYADFPPASPETWGEKTDAAESADWFNSKYIIVAGSNLSMTRTPDVHFAAEARQHGTKLVVLSPDFSQVSKYADWWLPVTAGMDGALFLAMAHVILAEFHAQRDVPYFSQYLRRFSDAPFLVVLEPGAAGHAPARMLRASELARYAGEENGAWKPLVLDRASGAPRMPQGSMGFRWQAEEGRWNLELRDGRDGAVIDPLLTLLDHRDEVLPVAFAEPGGGRTFLRGVPVRHVETDHGTVRVTTVLDLLMAHFGVSRGLEGDYPRGYDDEEAPFTPAWQERYTGIGRGTVARLAREWATTAERTNGKCTVIVGSGVNHWYHANLQYRAAITPLVLCGCVGVNGGGLGHYTGQEKLAPTASWAALAMALDWGAPPRLQNGPSFHYVHSDQWRYEAGIPDVRPAAGPFAHAHTLDHQVDAVRRGWLPFYPQFDRSPIELVRDAVRAGARSEEEISRWVAEQLRSRALRFAVEDPDAPQNWPRVWLIWRANALLSSAKGHEYFLRHYLGLEGSAVADDGAAADVVREAVFRRPAPRGKLDLVVDVNFRIDTSALYADVVLPAATWYEKDDLNTTDLHSYIHPLGAAVPPCWESRTDWETFRALAEKVSALARVHFPEPFRDLVATPLLHDTRDEIAQPEVRDWSRGECAPVPGVSMPHLSVVERDYPNLHRRFCAFGPRVREVGVEDRGVHMPVADLYDAYAREAPATEWNGVRMPSLVQPTEVANVILRFAPETNGELAWRGFKAQERRVGLPLADLAERHRAIAYDFLSVVKQPRRILTSPCWSGVTNDGRAYAPFVINVERLVPWRTLTGRQHLYLDHPAYRAFGESLPAFKPRLDVAAAGALARSGDAAPGITLNCLTPHGKWHMHTTYYDNLRMLTLSRGVEPFWLNDRDAAEIGVADNDWVEAFNDDGVVVTRAVVSARIPRGVTFFYHAPERTISFPRSPLRGDRRGGGHNSLTRLRLKPVLMVGGYAQHCYRFNDYGPPASDRDGWVVVRRLPGAPRFH
ncbi:nitrate reductase subunit alpha [Anaeromyxobacter oryzisoli]|uniref:nitrate reductase subunit alpha n=1 Tax=Anaeromyxobacter oryzisoli TaxID=2925408 RepID=UPI001F561523|nr:nitrate reductase subunit alpha [Anaeromyxobacter sp. SG63]